MLLPHDLGSDETKDRACAISDWLIFPCANESAEEKMIRIAKMKDIFICLTYSRGVYVFIACKSETVMTFHAVRGIRI